MSESVGQWMTFVLFLGLFIGLQMAVEIGRVAKALDGIREEMRKTRRKDHVT